MVQNCSFYIIFSKKYFLNGNHIPCGPSMMGYPETCQGFLLITFFEKKNIYISKKALIDGPHGIAEKMYFFSK